MIKERLSQSLQDFGNALDRLEEILKEPLNVNSYVIDAAIQRFEFTYELCWKTIKYALENEGKPDINSPRAAFREAYKMNWIENEDLWLEMVESRNLTSHTYRYLTALQVYDSVKHFYPALRKLYIFLNNDYQ